MYIRVFEIPFHITCLELEAGNEGVDVMCG